jgi:hypothetical protein
MNNIWADHSSQQILADESSNHPASCKRRLRISSLSVMSCVLHSLLVDVYAELAVQNSSNLWACPPVVLLLKVLMPGDQRRAEDLSLFVMLCVESV